jgi:pyruvate dehydrogenase E2 component (dihydrolipoamide acetyltransferase)
MARWEFKLPDIGEGVTEGEIVSWLVRSGDAVREDQPVVEVMTDKATVTITAPKAGTVVETRGKVGEIVHVHSVLVVFELDGGVPGTTAHAAAQGTNGHVVHPEGPARSQKADPKEDEGPARSQRADPSDNEGPARSQRADPSDNEGPAATAVGDIRDTLPGLPAARGASAAVTSGYFQDKPLATPATRKFARDLNVDLRHVPPSGAQGRVTRKDVEAFARAPIAAHAVPSGGGVALSAVAPAPSAARAPAPAVARPPAPGSAAWPVPGSAGAASPTALQPSAHPAPSRVTDRGALEERVPLAGVRRRIAQKMAQSTHTAAHFTFVEECDVTTLKALRARLRAPAEAAGVKLTFLPFIVKAAVAALKKHPYLNATLDEPAGEIVFRRYFHVGVATATDAGLLVPVVKDADRKSILDIARDIDRLAIEARAGRAKLEDLQGSTFTITSLGSQGGLFATPIINFPEVAILGVHQMKQRPVVKDGQIVIGDVMLLSLSFDHRVVDGHVGAAFAYEVIRYLEDPDALWLEMA